MSARLIKAMIFILDQGNSLSFYVYMNAPKDKNLAGKKAVNETVTNARNFAGDSAGPSDRLLKYKAHSEITLHNPELELHKESNPATGTELRQLRLQMKRILLSRTLSRSRTRMIY